VEKLGLRSRDCSRTRFFDLESILTARLGDRRGSDDSQTCSQTDPFASQPAKQNASTQVIAIHEKPQ